MMHQLALALGGAPAPTFGNFVAGRNEEVLSQLAAIAEGRSRERFVYLWGVPGSGRTHLLRAVAAAVADRGGRAVYVDARPDATALPDIEQVDALVVDDVERLAAHAQVALFNAFNALRERGGALVASGDAPAVQLPLRPDVVTRLGWGLVYQVHALSDAEKVGALASHAAARGFALADGITEHLLRHVARDMGSLIATLDALDRYSLEAKRPVTLALVRELVRELERTRELERQLELPMNPDEGR
jgi:DnaA family protein